MTHVRFPNVGTPAATRRSRAIAVARPAPSPAVVTALHALDRTGELLAALVIVAGGAALVGFASLL